MDQRDRRPGSRWDGIGETHPAKGSPGWGGWGSRAGSKGGRDRRCAGGGFGQDATQAWLAGRRVRSLVTSPRAGGGGGVGRVLVGGILATGSAAYLDVVLEQVLRAASAAVIVDLSDVAFVGVRGIAALVRAAGRAINSPRALCVVAPFDRNFVRHLDILGLTGLLGRAPRGRGLPTARVLGDRGAAAGSQVSPPARRRDGSGLGRGFNSTSALWTVVVLGLGSTDVLGDEFLEWV
jgi:anti-anti-sigma regulatory factor